MSEEARKVAEAVATAMQNAPQVLLGLLEADKPRRALHLLDDIEQWMEIARHRAERWLEREREESK